MLVTFAAFGNPALATQLLAHPARQGDMAFWGAVAASLEVTEAQKERLRTLLQDLTRQTQQLSAAEQHLLAAIRVRFRSPSCRPVARASGCASRDT